MRRTAIEKVGFRRRGCRRAISGRRRAAVRLSSAPLTLAVDIHPRFRVSFPVGAGYGRDTAPAIPPPPRRVSSRILTWIRVRGARPR
jgi:hypothetical protein